MYMYLDYNIILRDWPFNFVGGGGLCVFPWTRKKIHTKQISYFAFFLHKKINIFFLILQKNSLWKLEDVIIYFWYLSDQYDFLV